MKKLLGFILILPVTIFFLYGFIEPLFKQTIVALWIYGSIAAFIIGIYLIKYK